MNKRHFVILGAGISGLSLAWFLKQKFADTIDLTILEKSDRIGGCIHSIQHDGFHFELGPHSIRAEGNHAALSLVHQLGMKDQILWPHPHASLRYLYYQQRLCPLPRNPLQLIFSPLRKGVISALWHDWRTPSGSGQDESVYDFIIRRLNRDVAERFIDPLVSGIYAGDMRQLSVKACFPKLYEMEQQHGSLVRGMLKRQKSAVNKQGMFTMEGGMETLPQELGKRLQNDIQLNAYPKALKFSENEVEIALSNGKFLKADHLFSTVPAHAMAELIKPHHHALARLLLNLEYASIVVVNLGYRQLKFGNKGFGYLVPSSENENILGVIWDSSVFPEQDRTANETRLTVMMGGSKRPDICLMSQSEQLEIALNAVRRHLRIESRPDVFHVHLAKNAVPQYRVGHMILVKQIEDYLKRFSKITLLGSSFYGVSVNDCIANAALQAKLFE